MAAVTGSAKRAVLQAGVIVALALLASVARGFLPNHIAWNGRWPASDTTAEDAYKMMSQAGDPAFVAIGEAIELHRHGERFLDARDAGEYKAGHIPGARTLPFYDMENTQGSALAGAASDSLLIIYCEGVGCELSLLLGRQLQQAGYTNVRIFYGGFPEWKNAGMTVEK